MALAMMREVVTPEPPKESRDEQLQRAMGLALDIASGESSVDQVSDLTCLLPYSPSFERMVYDLEKSLGVKTDFSWEVEHRPGAYASEEEESLCLRGYDLRHFVAKVFLAGIVHGRFGRKLPDISLDL